MHASSRTNVNDVISAPNRIFIVFDNDDRVAEITQILKRVQQPVIVSLMQADGWFIEYIHDTLQSGTNLTGEANTLRFTARQALRAAIKRQIVEANVDQKIKTLLDFGRDLVGDFLALTLEFQIGHK